MDSIKWEAPEYIHWEKSNDWYWIVGIIAVSVAIVAILLGNVIFGILIVVSGFTLSIYASRPAKIIPVEITNKGVRINELYYPYVHLESFWVETREPFHKVILKSKKKLMPYIAILIEDVDPEDIHTLLKKHLLEEEHVEPFLEKLLIYFGF